MHTKRTGSHLHNNNKIYTKYIAIAPESLDSFFSDRYTQPEPIYLLFYVCNTTEKKNKNSDREETRRQNVHDKHTIQSRRICTCKCMCINNIVGDVSEG